MPAAENGTIQPGVHTGRAAAGDAGHIGGTTRKPKTINGARLKAVNFERQKQTGKRRNNHGVGMSTSPWWRHEEEHLAGGDGVNNTGGDGQSTLQRRRHTLLAEEYQTG